MKSIVKCLLLLFFSSYLSAQIQNESVASETYQEAEQLLSSNTNPLVSRANVSANWLSDGRFWYQVIMEKGYEYVLYDPKTMKRKIEYSKKKLLDNVDTPVNKTRANWREVLSPDGSKAVYIKDWNLYYRDTKSGDEFQLTTNGIENFGYATDNAGWRKSERPVLLWSPDSKKISTFRQDQRHVSDMYLVSTNVGAPKLSEWKYPLPQDEKVIQIHRIIIEVDNAKIIPLKVDPDPRRGTLCDDISCEGSFDDNIWSEAGKTLAFVSSSRDHKIAHLRIANAETGEVRDLHKETVETQYESGQGAINWKYLPSSNEFIWYSEKDDWGHLYLYDLKTGKLKNQITKGDFVVTRVEKVDEKNRLIYFHANGRERGRDPYFSHFYSVDFNGKNLTLLSPKDGHHSISISKDGKYFVDNYSQPNVPNVAELRSINGKLIEVLEKADISELLKSNWVAPKPFTVKSADQQFDLYGLMFVPSDLDESKKYPVVNYIYPGPQGGSVGSRSFRPSRGDHQALAELGFIVVLIDGSCNPGRSKSFHDACYGDMSGNTLPDQMAGLQQLIKTHPYIDLNKVGVWGHSGGGFATASALLKYPDFYKVGIAESGNHDNRNYEDDWGERYNGLMVKGEDGKTNYEQQANQLYAKNLKGKLMLAHGGMDDNVPPYNTYLLVDALNEANKDYDLVIFPNARHGFGKGRNYMMRKRWDYFVKHLQGKTPPKEFKFSPRKKDPRLDRS